MGQLVRRILYMIFGVLPGAGAMALIFYFVTHPKNDLGFSFTIFSILAFIGFLSGLVAVFFLNNLNAQSRRIIRMGVIMGSLIYFPLAIVGLVYLHSFILLAPLMVGIALIFELGAPNKAQQRAEKRKIKLEELQRAAAELGR